MLKGLSCAIFACLIWGTSYVIPNCSLNFSPDEMLLGRYLAYGLISLLLFIKNRQPLKRNFGNVPPLKVILALALVGFLFYDLLDIINIRTNGTEAVGLIYGTTLIMSPLVAKIFGKRLWPTSMEWVGMLVPFFGLVILEWGCRDKILQSLVSIGGPIAIAQACISYFFTKTMSYHTKKSPNPEQAAGNTTILIGVSCFILSAVGWLYTVFDTPGGIETFFLKHSTKDWCTFLGVSLISGIGATWLATWIWCIAACRLPYEILANFMLADLVAGKVYEYFIIGVPLNILQVIAMCILMSSGIILRKIRELKGKVDQEEKTFIVSTSADTAIPLI